MASLSVASSLHTEQVPSFTQADAQLPPPQSLGAVASPGSVGGTPAQPAPVAVLSALPPVPSYLVEKIMQGQFIHLTLLRLCNLRHLRVMEPAPIQLGRLVRSELQPIRNFQDWLEAWAVHGAVIANNCPEKAADQFSYFLLLASAKRDIPRMGWLDYDVDYRKHAADKDSVRWGRSCLPCG